MNIDSGTLARMVIFGYLLTISIETPVLFWGLGRRYSTKEKLCAGVLLTGCSYPFVTLVFPFIWNPYTIYPTYLTVSEVFAPLSECVVFALLFQRRKSLTRLQRAVDLAVVVLANLVSFVAGEIMKHAGLRFG